MAGRRGSPDAFEQPFRSLDFSYAWCPYEAVTVKAKVQSILDEEIEIEQGGTCALQGRALFLCPERPQGPLDRRLCRSYHARLAHQDVQEPFARTWGKP